VTTLEQERLETTSFGPLIAHLSDHPHHRVALCGAPLLGIPAGTFGDWVECRDCDAEWLRRLGDGGGGVKRP
jgi:hypothetical protein